MTLREIIEILEKQPQDKVLPYGFANPHSYRGYYDQVGFEPARDIKVADMLTAVKSAVGATFQGYKGGDFEMTEHTDCHLAWYGICGEEIGPTLMTYIIGNQP